MDAEFSGDGNGAKVGSAGKKFVPEVGGFVACKGLDVASETGVVVAATCPAGDTAPTVPVRAFPSAP